MDLIAAATINITAETLVCLVSAILAASLYVSRETDSRQGRLFLMLFILLSAACFCDTIAWLVGESAGSLQRVVCLTANFLTFFLEGVFALVFALYIFSCIFPYESISKPFLSIVCSAIGLYQLILIISQFNGMLYTVDLNNVYTSGPYYFIIPAFAIVFLLSIGGYIVYHRVLLGTRDTLILSSYAIMPLIGMIMQFVFIDLVLVHIAFLFSLLIIYVNYHVQQSKNHKLEALESQTATMLSQIQPHFLYNTLGSIQELYSIDSKQADKAMQDFSCYLRGNMNSLNQPKPISFEEELQHVRLFLSLEKMRFEDRLKVVFDIQANNFALPALTVQPLVENAVNHGIMKKPEGGTLVLATSETKDTFVIRIKDDGVGFAPDTELADGKTHLGIANVKKRLAIIVGGSLQIESAPGKGSVATILIPKEVKRSASYLQTLRQSNQGTKEL